MLKSSSIVLVIAVIALGSLPPSVNGQLFNQVVVPEQIVRDSTAVLEQSMNISSGIPQSLLREAQGIVIVPNMMRGAFVVGVQRGRGVLLTRDAQGGWQAPRMIVITGGSIGYQIGVQSTDLVLLLRTQQSVANLLGGTLKIGVDASAAAGPVGRQASAATDLQMKAEILSYSRSRGAFIGVSIDGSSITLDPQAEAFYYQPPGTVPASAGQLIQALNAYSGAVGPVAVVPATTNQAGWREVGTGGTAEFEAARQQLDAVSQKLATELPDDWKRFLTLPPEIYTPGGVPSPESVENAVARYQFVSQRPEYASLTSRPEFQETLSGLERLRSLRPPAVQPQALPPPPTGFAVP